jgi:hypothetical protein
LWRLSALLPLTLMSLNMWESHSDQDNLSVEEALQILLFAIGDDPHSPVGCFSLILSCTSIYDDAEDNYERRGRIGAGLPDIPPALLTCFMRFLTAYRTNKDVKAVERKLFDCRCANGPPLVRDSCGGENSSIHLDPHDRIGDLVKFMVTCVSNALGKKPKLKLLYRRPNRDDVWPQVWEDLFPYNPSICIHALAAWQYPGTWTLLHAPYTIISAMISLFGPAVLKGLLQSPSVRHLVAITQDNCVEEGGLDPRQSGDRPPNTWRVMRSLNDLYQVSLIIEAISSLMFDDELLMWVQHTTEDLGSDNKLRHFAEGCLEMRSMVCALPLRTMDWSYHGGIGDAKRMVDKIQQTASTTVARICFAVPNLLSLQRLQPDVLEQIADYRELCSTPSLRLYIDHTIAHWKHRCYGPGCLVNEHALRRSFKACSGCKRAKYCSRRCQREAWKLSNGSHRDACRTLRVLHRLERRFPANVEIIKRLPADVPVEQARVAKRHLDAVHRSQLDAMGEQPGPIDLTIPQC